MYRRVLVEKTGLYSTDTLLLEDNELWGRALKQGLRFANIPEYLLKYRIDKNFYKRRSGFRYGWNYIKTKFEINYALKTPFYSYLYIFLIGLIKIMPPLILRFVYPVSRN